MPEIDVPGHCYAMLQAIPELRDPGEHGSYFSVQGFPNNCLNPAREETYRVLETIFDELIELFPSRSSMSAPTRCRSARGRVRRRLWPGCARLAGDAMATPTPSA